jgi:hypothetical protein
MSETNSKNFTDQEDNLFEESVLNSSFSSKSDTSIQDEYVNYSHTHEEKIDESIDEFEAEAYSDHDPSDLVNLRSLFDEEAVDPSNNDNTMIDFDEIPDDIDIDEPIEIEELSHAGKVMNVVVQASMIIFGLIALGFIINAGLVVGAILSSNFQSRVFIDVSNLDKDIGRIDATIMTEAANFGSFIEGELDPVQPVRAVVFLSNEEIAQPHDAICEILFQPPEDKEKIIKFNGGVRNVFHLQDIKLKLNPNFDASRLSGFMEPKNGEKFHARYPRNLIIFYSANLRINSFWVPIPYRINMFTKIEMDKPLEPEMEKKKLEKMNAFDFNPKIVDISPPEAESLTIKVRQPVPKFYAPPFYKIAVHIPEIELIVKQFTNTDPYATPEIKNLFSTQSSPLVTAKVSPFRMIMSDDDLTPNIFNIEAKINRENFDGLINVLKAIRDDKLGTLAFLFASSKFDPDNLPNLPIEPAVNSSNESKEPEPIAGCKFNDFMKTFWGRQAYPVGDGTAALIPSIPESYDSAKNSAVEINFNGIKTAEIIRADTKIKRNFLEFKVTASTHYVISEYRLPLLMLSGQLPLIQFKMIAKSSGKPSSEVAKIAIKHVNPNIPPPKSNLKKDEEMNKKEKGEEKFYPFGDHLIFDISIEILDLKVLTHFALKLSKMSKIILKEGSSIQAMFGKMFNGLEGAEIIADFDVRFSSWVSKIASVFNMKFDLTGEKVQFLYAGNDKPVIPEKGKSIEVKADPEYSKEAEDAIIKSLDELLGVVFEFKSKEEETEIKSYERHVDMILSKVKELKEKVAEIENKFYLESKSTTNFAHESKIECEKILSKSIGTVLAKPVADVVKESDVKSDTQLEYHEKMVKVRNLLNSRIALRKKTPIGKEMIENSLYAKVDSNTTEMTIKTAIALNESEILFDDYLIFTWKSFDIVLADEQNVQLAHMILEPGEFKYFLADGSLSRSKESIKLITKFGPESSALTVPDWMKSFKNFVDGLLSKKIYFISYRLSLTASKTSVSWSSELPTAAISAFPSTIASSTKGTAELTEPGFFDNLAKSHFDFIGYGFYRLIFHAILPNPDKCPTGSSILNVELDLPQTTTYLFAAADSTGLWENTCVASINTTKPLRIWTQIVDGVLCNMYAVADGMMEQETSIHARIPNDRAGRIINSFEDVLLLRNSYGVDEEIEKKRAGEKDKVIETESPLLKYRQKIHVPLSKIPYAKRYALITAVPISLEILNFERMVKIIDSMGRKERIKLGSADLTTSNFKTSEASNLFNVLTNALAGNYLLEFNTPEQLEKAETEPPKIIYSNESHKVILNVDIPTSNSKELIVKTSIEFPNHPKEVKVAESEIPYVVYNSLKAEERFLHPVIRWGNTELMFFLPKFKITLKLSAGDIQVTNDGSKILFEALKNFEIELSIKAHSNKKSLKHEKDIFTSSSIRQFFSKCRDFYENKVYSSDDFGDPIETTSTVSYGSKDNQKFYFLGLVDLKNFFLLQGVILRRIFPEKADDDIPDPSCDSREDPTYIDFGMLISLGDGTETDAKNMPNLAVPCFFTNFCSSEQLGYTKLNRNGLLTVKDHVNATLTVGNTFGPLVASIAAGFSTFLPLFYMDVYPGTLEWKLSIPDDQVLGMEMNGLGMVYGKADAIKVVRKAEIPYLNRLAAEEKKPKKKKDIKYELADECLGNDENIKFEERENFNDKFFNFEKHKFNDFVKINVKTQVPDSVPHLLRNMLWPLFLHPMDTLTLHPPIVNIRSDTEFFELSHAPISVAISDSMEYKGFDGEVIKPSILTRIFAAFIEESSSTGMEMHKQDDGPSSFRFYSSYKSNFNRRDFSNSITKNFMRPEGSSGESLIEATLWIQFPWSLGSIGFDFGKKFSFQVTLQEDDEPILVEGSISEHQMIGKVARMRIDLIVPSMTYNNFSTILMAARPFVLKIPYLKSIKFLDNFYNHLSHYLLNIREIPLGINFNVDNNFIVQSELAIPKSFFEDPVIPANSPNNLIYLTRSKFNVKKLIDKYGPRAPQAIACVYNYDIKDVDKKKQQYLWTQIDLSMTRVYYPEISQIKPGDKVTLYLQLRTIDQVAVCGILSIYHGLAVMIEYIKPSHSLDVLFKKDVTVADPPRAYIEAARDDVTSVFLVEHELKFTGRYKIFVGLIPSSLKKSDSKLKEADLMNLSYKEIKFTELYVQNPR